MMNRSEDYIYSLLQRSSNSTKVWKFFECFDDAGFPDAQAKRYPKLGYWVAYPDFECYEKEKLAMLVEVKGLYDFFDGEDGKIAMKFRNYKSYQRVRAFEKVDVRICFVVEYRHEKFIFWESIDKIINFPYIVKEREYREFIYKTGVV